MKLEELMERIHLPEEARRLVLNEQIDEKEYSVWRDKFYRDMEEFVKEWKETGGCFGWALEFYLKLALDTFEEYQKNGYAEEMFDQTFYDITIWCSECYRKHGVYGVDELLWLGKSVKMELFRLGRLQFEPMQIKRDIKGNGQEILAGTKGLNVHIPAGEPLVYEECLKSFERASDFFGEEYRVFVCESWLLSPHLKEILPETSNIIRFQELFCVTEVGYAYPQAEQRIFGKIFSDKRQYPENTALQRKAKEYVLTGRDLGIGTGYRFLSESLDRMAMKIDIPGFKLLKLKYLVLDYNGTIAVDGVIPENIRGLLKKLAQKMRIYIVTADTHGNAKAECAKLPVEVRTFPSGDAAQAKRKIVESLGNQRCVCLGNGRNDMLMFQTAALSVAVMDAEGMYGRLGTIADVCVRSMEEGLNLLMNEKRLIATLRG